MEELKRIDTAAKIRLLIFTLIILWGVSLSVYFSRKIFDIRFHDGLLNVGLSFLLVLIYAVLILVLTMIPMFILRITALKDNVVTYPEEATLGNRIMLCGFIIVMILGILVTEGTIFLPLPVFSLMWYSSGFLCYITQIKGQTLD